jgi:RimJ/RimL family protein N-acetyltransferase
MTIELLAAERAGGDHLARALGVAPPPTWPPELYDDDDLARYSRLLADPANAGWVLYYVLERANPSRLVGVAGFAGRPGPDGVVEVGYSVLPPYRRRGIASEALATLVRQAFGRSSVRCIAAETFPSLEASIGVLRRNGFRPVPASGRNGTLRFELPRGAFASRQGQ